MLRGLQEVLRFCGTVVDTVAKLELIRTFRPVTISSPPPDSLVWSACVRMSGATDLRLAMEAWKRLTILVCLLCTV